MITLRLVFSAHAKEQLLFRGFSTREVEEAIRRGSKRHLGPKTLAAFRDYVVVYIRRGTTCFVITVMYP